MDSTATPVAQKPRNASYHLRKPVKKLLDERINKEIFEEILTNDAIIWCSPFLVQRKPKFAEMKKDDLKPHRIRANAQALKIDDLIYHLHIFKVFSTLDLKQGYHQLMLELETREVATVYTMGPMM